MTSRLRTLAPALVLTTVVAGCAAGSVAGSAEPGAAPPGWAQITRPDVTSSPADGSGTTDQSTVDRWSPTRDNRDPSVDIEDIFIGETVDQGDSFSYPDYQNALHVAPDDRVAYDRFPPVGGPHDSAWAACNGIVYDIAVRDESMVHALEHGAVWIAYQPDLVTGPDLDLLVEVVQDTPYLTLSPYPTLERAVSVQSWGHQLQVDSVQDERIGQFLLALLRNPYVYPEVGATCDQPTFDLEDPPAFDGSPRDSSAVPLDGGP